MKNVLKMIKSDCVVVGKLSFPYVAIYLVVSSIFSLFGVPIFSMIDFAVTLCIFAPMEIINDTETKKLYGILPIEKSCVTRAGFMEIILSLFVGEIITIISVLISNITTLYEILPEKIATIIRNFFNPEKNNLSLNFGQFMFFVMIAFTFMFIISVYLKMINEISGQSVAIVHLLVIVSITTIAIIILSKLALNNQLSNIKTLIPSSTASRIICYIVFNIVCAVVGVVCCEHTVKKLAKKEL